MNLLKQSGRRFIPRYVRNWLRSPAQTAHWIWNEFQFGVGIKKSVEIRPGWNLVYHPAAFRLAYFAQQSDPDQVNEFDGFIGQCQMGMKLLDIGAHFGLFSLAALHYGGMNAKAVAVDPSPTACRIMRIQASLNSVSYRLEILQASVGSRVGWTDMVDSGIQSARYFVQPSDHAGRELTRTRSITLDALTEHLQDQPTHIKIDVEGCEEEVLLGAIATLSRTDGPLLFIELHNQIVSERGGDPRKVLKILGELGYDTVAPEGARLNHCEIISKPLIRVMARKNSCSKP